MPILEVSGAQIYFEVRGEGAPILLIPGANGDAQVFPPFADCLAADHTVITYDRRGFSRSPIIGAQDYSRRLATDAEDAACLIRQFGLGPATVFGTSSGAVVALQLILDHPDIVERVIPFEAAAMPLFDEGERWMAIFGDLYDLYRRNGPAPALEKFRRTTFAPIDYPLMSGGPKPAVNPQKTANAIYWFERELREYTSVVFDLGALAPYADRILPAFGRASKGYPTAEASIALAERLNISPLALPDGHVGYATQPEAFADALRSQLASPGRGADE